MPDTPSQPVRSFDIERVREPAGIDTYTDLIDSRIEGGWTLVALEWQRPAESPSGTLQSVEVPYGLQVAQDFLHLEENPVEVEAMVMVLDLLVDDHSHREIANRLNERGYRTRSGAPWTQTAVFDLMPRIVEAAPDIFGTDDWRSLRRERKQRRLEAV